MTVRYMLRSLAVFLVLLASVSTSLAQRKVPTAAEMLSVNGAQGTEFWITVPPNELLPFPVNGLDVYIASAYDTEVTIFDAAGNDVKKRKITANDIRTLSDDRGETNWSWEVREYEQTERKAIRLTADKPFSVYVLNSKVTTSDGYLAIPTSAWGKNYVAVSYFDFREFSPWAGGFVIVAKENGTVVNINLRGQGKLDARTSGGKRIGDRLEIVMNEGEIYSIVGDGQTRGVFDLTGTEIRANQPIGVWGFHQRTTMPNLLINGNGRDHLVEMLPPVETWGKKYVTVEYNRQGSNPNAKGDVFRVVASQPNTKWTLKYYDKTSKALIGQGGGVLANAGDFQDLSQAQGPSILINGYSVWEADKPIFVMQYATSASFDGDQVHDPFMINVVPEEQFIPNTIFQTPTDTKFYSHKLNLIVWADVNDPDYVDNLKSLTINDVPIWNHPQSAAPTLLYNHMGDNLHWVTLNFGTIAQARRLNGNGNVKFGGYIYGYGSVDSYGWPAASGFRPTTSFDTMPPVLTAEDLCGDFAYTATEFRNIPDPPRDEPLDSDQVETGMALIDFVPSGVSYNYRIVLITAQTMPRDPSFKEFKFRLEVIDKTKDAYAEFFVQDWADNITYDTVQYFAPQLSFAPSPLKFGEIRLGTTKTMDVTVRNEGDGPVTLKSNTFKTGTYFSIVNGSLPPEVVLEPAQTHTFTIQYSGDRETADIERDFDLDTLTIEADCGEAEFGMEGVAGVPCIVVEDFKVGTVGAGEERCKAGGLRVRNQGSDTLVITDITGFLGTNFTVTNLTPALPIRVLPKAAVNLETICYQRNDVGTDSIDVVFRSNADGPFCESDSISVWTGATESPGPGIIGHNWLLRRENTLHPEFGVVNVYNSGNQSLTVRDVTFADGSKYFPAGSNEANYVFKLGRLLDNGAPVTDFAVSNGSSVFVEAWFRPADDVAYSATIVPVWAQAEVPARSALLEGEGTLPTITTQGAVLTCAETPEAVAVSRDLVFTNNGTEDLTITNLRLAAGSDPAWAFAAPGPAASFVVPFVAGSNVVRVPVEFTRPTLNNNAFALTVEFEHDAVRGNGTDAVITPVTATERFTVGSCSGPAIEVTDIDFGRNLASCDAPILEFTITNTGGGATPLEIREMLPVGADAGAFSIISINDDAGRALTLPFTLAAQVKAIVRVRFTPTEPAAAPWNDRVYNAQFHILNYEEGRGDELQPDTYVNVTGVGFVIPVSASLTQELAGQLIAPSDRPVRFTVSGQSGNWNRAAVRQFEVTMVYNPTAVYYNANSVARAGLPADWTVSEPAITQVSPTQWRATFTANGTTPIAANGDLFTFTCIVLLGEEFNSKQDLELSFDRACLIPSAQGTSTEITNCALTKRVISAGTIQYTLDPVAPNPVSTGTAKVSFGVGIKAPTTVELIDARGQVVERLVDQTLDEGEYNLEFPTAKLSNGLYFLRMTSADYTSTQQVMVAR